MTALDDLDRLVERLMRQHERDGKEIARLDAALAQVRARVREVLADRPDLVEQILGEVLS